MSDTDQKLSLEVFVPAREELTLLSSRAKAVDISNAEQVHAVRIELRDARISITKRGKELREGALKFQKEVIKREGELVGIIEPEEERLKAIDEEFKLREEMEKRRHELPSRLEALIAIGDEQTTDEEEILTMDDNEFNAYRLRRIEAKLIADKAAAAETQRIQLEEREAKLRQEESERKAKIEKEDKELAEVRAKAQAEIDKVNAQLREKQEADSKKLYEEREAVRQEAERIATEQRIKADAERKAKEALEMREREEKLEAEKKARVEAERAKAQKFQAFLDETGYDQDSDIIKWEGLIATVYRKIGTYKVIE